MSNEPNDKQLEENLKRLLGRGADLPRLSPERRAQMLDALKAQRPAPQQQEEDKVMKVTQPVMRVATWLALAAAVAVAVIAGYVVLRPKPPQLGEEAGPEKPFPIVVRGDTGRGGLLRKTLADGTILIARAGAKLTVEGRRTLKVEKGDIYLIVAKAKEPFVVRTAHGTATATGTRFGLSVGATTQVAVAQGVVKLGSEAGEVEVVAGQQGELSPGLRPTREPAPRISYLVSWAKDALAQVKKLVEKKKRDTGELVAKDPWGQEVRLTLRKYHVDVYIEDGIARTTIDQTYFNHMPWQIEGTFYFPLPPDASVSRLAMYVGGTLNEGGMVSRERGQQIYTEIKFQRRDPALLEMQEGNVFKMRIFPIEGRQEKRIFLSYTQKLPELYGTLRYWFPMDHTHSNAREVTIHVRAKGAAGRYTAESSTHELGINEHDGDLVMNWRATDVKPDQDLLLHLVPTKQARRRSFATFEKDGYTYVFGRVTPSLPGGVEPQPRQWIVINDVSASRSKLDVQAQAYILERLIAEADDPDTVALINLNTTAQVKGQPFVSVRDPAAKRLIEAAKVGLPLGGTHIASGLEAAARLIRQHKCANPHILYLGDGVATDGRTELDVLLKRIPEGATFVGIGVGKKADQRFLQAAADQTGGMFALINPDEDIDWRVFDLVAALNTPRLVGLKARFETAGGKAADIIAYPSARALAEGETLFVVGRTKGGPPAWLVVEGKVGGEAFSRRYALADARGNSAFIPRFWAKRHIDELLKSGPEHKDEIIALSKQYYVMTPYTSLIVLENDKMYEEFKVERGRKDHWALYPAPKTIKVVKEPLDRSHWGRWWGWGVESEDAKIKATARPKSVKDIVESVQFRINAPFYFWRPQRHGQGRFALYNLVDLDADPSGLLTWLINKAGVTPTKLPAGKPGQPKPNADGEPGPPVLRMYAPVEEALVLDLWGRTLGMNFAGDLSLERGTLLSGPPTVGYGINYGPPQVWNNVRFVDSGWVINAPVMAGEALPRQGSVSFWFRPDASELGDYQYSRLAINGEAPQSISFAFYQTLPTLLLVDESRSMEMAQQLAASLPGTGLTHEGYVGSLNGQLPPRLHFAFQKAVGDRMGRIRGDIRAFNRRWGGYYWGDGGWGGGGGGGGGWSYGSAWDSLDLRKSHSARIYGGLEAHDREMTMPPVVMPPATRKPMSRSVLVSRDRPMAPSLAIAVYGRAIKTVPGTAPALAADFLIPRRDELRGKKDRTEKEDRILKAIGAALEGIEAAYPRFEDSGVFWGYRGRQYRPQAWTFQPPTVQCHRWYNWSFDLTRYAGGLYSTTFDILNEVAAAYPTKPSGKVSDDARGLIAAARKAITPVRIRFGKDGPAMLVAAGDRFALTHTTEMYLEERMVCDGEATYHLYPELGLAARRTATPTRLAALRRIAPHLIGPADWMARRYHVEVIEQKPDRFTLKLAPVMRVAQPPSAVQGKQSAKGAQAGAPVPHSASAPKPPFHILVSVATDGRILAKTLFAKDKLRLKLTYAYDGAKVTAKWFDAEGKELTTASFQAEPFEPKADTFKVDAQPYVVFDMPLRRPSYYQAKIAEPGKGADKRLPGLKRHLALAHMQELRWRRWGGSNDAAHSALMDVFKALAKTKAKAKLGDLTLLGCAGYRQEISNFLEQAEVSYWAGKTGLPKSHPVVAYYVAMHSGWQKVGELRGSVGTGLIGHLVAYHASVTGDAKARAKNLGRFLTEYERSPLLFAAVWYVASGTSRPQEWFRLFDHPRWRSLAILMAAQRANKPEQRTRIAEAFAKLHGELSEKGLEVPISTQMYSVLRSVEGGKHWQTVVRAALKVATEKDRAAPLLRFAELALRCGERKLAEEALGRVRKLAKKPDSLMVRLALAQTYWAGNQFKDALRLYDELFAAIEAKGIAASPALLASAARLAEQAGQPGRAIDLEERALVAEHPHLPELINLNAFRQRYQWLWRQYQARVNQAAKKKDAAAVAEWLARAEQLWARWHGVDGDNAAMVKQMATLQMTAGDKDAAWLYLSSLIDAKPRDPSSHGALASWYRGRGELAEAEQWLARAYTWDTANPQWLFERAKVLRDMGSKDEAKRVFRQIIDGKWAPGLERYKKRAEKEIKK